MKIRKTGLDDDCATCNMRYRHTYFIRAAHQEAAERDVDAFKASMQKPFNIRRL